MGRYRYFDLGRGITIAKKRRRILITCIALMFGVFTLLSTVASAGNAPKYTVRVIPSYVNEGEMEFQYIEASNHSDYGRQAAFGFPYKLVDIMAGEMSGEEEEEIESVIENMSEDFQGELEGFAGYFGITPERALYLIRTYVDYFPMRGECTVTLATGEATSGDETFLTQNIDMNCSKVEFTRFIYSRPWCIKINLTGIYKHAILGCPLIVEAPLVNEEHLGFGGNGLALRDHGEIDNGSGWSTYFLELLAIRTCKDVSEVRDLFYDPPGPCGRASGLTKNYETKSYPHH